MRKLDLEAGLPNENAAEAIPLVPLRVVVDAPAHEDLAPRDELPAPNNDDDDEFSNSYESLSWSFPRWSVSEEQQEAACSYPMERPSGTGPAAPGTQSDSLATEDSAEAGLSPLWRKTLDLLMATQRVDKPLWAAVKAKDPKAVREALAVCAPLAPHLPICSLLHWCFEHYTLPKQSETEKSSCEMEVILELLDWTKPLDVNCFHRGWNLLCAAIDWGSLKIVKVLLNRGANVDKVSHRGETALHPATRHPHILKYFLDNYNIGNTLDSLGYAPIHWAATYDKVVSMKLLLERFGEEQLEFLNQEKYKATAWHYVGTHDSKKVAEFLFRSPYRTGLQVANNDGETPVYATASRGIQSVTALLLRSGAFLSDKAKNGITVVEEIAKNFTDPLTFLEDTFDELINEEDVKVVCVNYSVLANHEREEISQIDVIKELVRCGLSKILMHPLIESLLYLRWKCLLPVFYTILAIYATFLIPFNIYLVTAFYTRDTTNASHCPASTVKAEVPCIECLDGWGVWILVTLMYPSLCLMLALECIYIYLQKARYFKQVESWVKLCGLLLGALVPALVACTAAPAPAPWQRHVACVALLLAWLQAMLLLSRFPGWGYYVLMFERVAINMLKVFVTSVCLVFGFSLCFMIQYHSVDPFDGPVAAFVKTLVMMSSEFDYEDLFGEDHPEIEDTRTVVRLVFVIFVIFIAIVLMNFMIGIAVSDINELTVIGNIRRLEKQVELLSNLEVLGRTKLGKYFKILRIRYHHAIVKTLEFLDNWFVVYLNYDSEPDEDTQALTSELKDALINIIRKKKKAEQENKVKQDIKDKLDALHNAVVGEHVPEKDTFKVKWDESGPSQDKSPVPLLTKNMKSLETALSTVVAAHEELNQKIDALKACMEDLHLKLARDDSSNL